MKAGFTRISREMFGPWALITGASSGIGAEFARQLAANGFDLALAARRLPLLEQAGAKLAVQYGIKYRTIQVDLADPGYLATIASATDDLDIGLVISNAGDMILGELLDSEPGPLFADMRLNVASHLGLTHHFGRRLAHRGRGGILLVSSTAALQPVPYTASYAAAKSYLLSLGEAVHHELARQGVTVTVLLPGATDTAMVTRFSDSTGISVHKPPMSLMLMTPGQLVSEGLAALRAGRARRIAGRANRAMTALTPRKVRTRMFTAMSEKAARHTRQRSTQ
jgi:short-subunit dehydrogenase